MSKQIIEVISHSHYSATQAGYDSHRVVIEGYSKSPLAFKEYPVTLRLVEVQPPLHQRIKSFFKKLTQRHLCAECSKKVGNYSLIEHLLGLVPTYDIARSGSAPAIRPTIDSIDRTPKRVNPKAQAK